MNRTIAGQTQEQEGEQPLQPMPPAMTLRCSFVSDSAVKGNRGSLKRNSRQGCSRKRDISASPVQIISFALIRQCQKQEVDGLGSLESLSSIISELSLPDSLTCKEENSFTRFEDAQAHENKAILDARPRFPVRQASGTFSVSSSSEVSVPSKKLPFASLPHQQKRSTNVDASPTKPVRTHILQRNNADDAHKGFSRLFRKALSVVPVQLVPKLRQQRDHMP